MRMACCLSSSFRGKNPESNFEAIGLDPNNQRGITQTLREQLEDVVDVGIAILNPFGARAI